jgi:hypothetical protein
MRQINPVGLKHSFEAVDIGDFKSPSPADRADYGGSGRRWKAKSRVGKGRRAIFSMPQNKRVLIAGVLSTDR